MTKKDNAKLLVDGKIGLTEVDAYTVQKTPPKRDSFTKTEAEVISELGLDKLEDSSLLSQDDFSTVGSLMDGISPSGLSQIVQTPRVLITIPRHAQHGEYDDRLMYEHINARSTNFVSFESF